MRRRISWGYARPSAVVVGLALANIGTFALCAGNRGSPSVARLIAAGALTAQTLQLGEYWRLVAYGFLHANVAHLLTNVASLLACGPALERRLGPTAFALVYFAALLGGGITSVGAHGAAFVGVGASGAILGVLGGLFALWILGKIDLQARFFAMNFGLLGLSSVQGSNVDWAAHLGGFGAGVASIAFLDLVGNVTRAGLRCKFPEFVKANLLVLAGLFGALLWAYPARSSNGRSGMIEFAVLLIGSLAFVKMIDLLLSVRRGLALTAFGLGICNGLIAYEGEALPHAGIDQACQISQRSGGFLEVFTRPFCLILDSTPILVFAIVLLFSGLLYFDVIQRGLRDVGFTSAMLMANRRRERG